ncbi:gamma-glutamyltransferase [Qipengyuania marisflavi]|uniref:Glutathione hydrolase proenzyme n=1 Tax=Qipengyuania marisflavi TaxID=2486356 RepID=A0A5S3P5Y5_9SPHN|nr:gamma-glutamyltransferase [Qipengyuania marisflavi]TMM48241.1 gamma-glutamyltransferase [Qipengyuania marisflavi]
MIRAFTVSLAAALLAGCATLPANAPAAPIAPPAGFAGTVTAADPRAEEAGMAMLRAGGNATDAAVATMLALTVVEPQSSGIGGGGFLVRGTAAGTAESFDGREKAPAAAGPEWFSGPDGKLPAYRESVRSGLSVGVPGNVAMAARAHAKNGRLPWAKLFEPAIALARDGFRINPRLHDYLVRMPEHAGGSPVAKALFYDAAGAAHPVGHVVTNSALARTFTDIAARGPQAFYTGALAEEIATTTAAATPHDKAMTPADLADYEAQERAPVCGNYRAYRICAMGPPTSGGVAVLQILGMLERFDLSALGAENPVTWHLFLEAQRLAYADRELYLADSDFVSVPVAGLVDPSYLAQRSALIDPATTLAFAAPGKPAGAPIALADGDEPEERGTSHLAAVDAAGTMVSYTSTIEGPFGSGLMASGFYLNNELTDFSRSPEVEGRMVANRVESGKRPRSSMSPAVVWDPQGRPFLAVGAAGGSTIPVQTARSIIAAIDFGASAGEAVGMPFIMAFGDAILVEQGTWLETAIPAFEALGHSQITARAAPVKGGAILRSASGWQGARDPRIESDLILP